LHDDVHDHDHGLSADLEALIRQAAGRRRALRWLSAGGAAASLAVLGCGGGGSDGSSATASTTTGTTGSGSSGTGSTTCSVIPEETAGPYPGDGSNGVNALALSGIVRSDIRSSFGSASGTASGVPLTVTLQLVNTNASCAGLAGYAVYLWHCDALGRYSLYTSGATDQNYLRGVQSTDSSGAVSFTTIFPGCYSGRMPHIHLEVYRSTTTATSFSNKLKTSQIAFPAAPCNAVYATSGYSGSAGNFAAISFATDNVFSDGVTTQLATVTGSVGDGYVATLEVGISG
jgi:protocatechuate 3,4-dioxygenase beta subunit